MVPSSLKKWFILHFIVDYIVALPLMAAPYYFLQLLGWETVDPLSTRLVAAALIGIGGVSFFARNAGVDTYRHMLQLKLLWSAGAVIGIGLSLLEGAPAFGWVFFAVFLVFFFIWLYYFLRLRAEG